MSRSMAIRPDLTVYFDGGCVLCRRLVSFLHRRDGADRIVWIDISRDASALLGSDITPRAALQHLHARLADGRVLRGAHALAAICSNLPGYRWAGRWLSRPPLVWLLDAGYRTFVVLYRLIAARDRCCADDGEDR